MSYAFSSDAANFQVDAIMDGAKDSGRAIDEVQFGVSVSLGDIGKVALGYENREDFSTMEDVTTYTTTIKSGNITTGYKAGGTISGSVMAAAINEALKADSTLMLEEDYGLGVSSLDVGGTLGLTVDVTPDSANDTPVAPKMEKGTCVVRNSDGAITDTNNSVTRSECTATGTASVFTVDPLDKSGDPDPTKDSLLPTPKYTGGGFTAPKDYTPTNVAYFGTVETKSVSLTRTVVSKADDEPTEGYAGSGDNFNKDDPKCATTGVICSQSAVYHYTNSDGEQMLYEGDTSATGQYNLDVSTLSVDGGTLMITMPDGSTETIENAISVALKVDTDISVDKDVDVTVTDTRELESTQNFMFETTATTKPKATPKAGGYQQTHVSVQLNLGAMTLGLGYSEKESTKTGSMDQKTTYVGASGSIGDTGMGWRAWTRDISNAGNTPGDRNPWGIGINKDLGGGAFTFVEHHDADKGASGNTIVALGVNF